MVEWWNIGMLILKGSFSFIDFSVKESFTNKPPSHFSKTHYSIIPLFQHSNWGEAPKFGFNDSF